jgi:hypothetical protein
MLPHFVRFRDLKERNIVQSWPALNDLIENEGFPRGRKLSPQIRVWTVDEVNAWLETRPFEPAEPRGEPARRAAAKAARLSAPDQKTQELREADEAIAPTRGPPA